MNEDLTEQDVLKLVEPTDEQEVILRNIMMQRETTEPSELANLVDKWQDINYATKKSLERKLRFLSNLEEKGDES